MGGGYSKLQSIADRFQKSRQAYNQYVQSQQKLETEALELNPNNVYAQKLQTESDAAKLLSDTHPPMLPGHNETAIQANDTPNTQTEQAEKESKNPTAENIGQSQKTVQSAAHEATVTVNQEDVAKSLRDKGTVLLSLFFLMFALDYKGTTEPSPCPLDLLTRKSCPIKRQPHALPHNGIDFSGQGITKQHPAVLKSKKLRIFKAFKTGWVNNLCSSTGILETK